MIERGKSLAIHFSVFFFRSRQSDAEPGFDLYLKNFSDEDFASDISRCDISKIIDSYHSHIKGFFWEREEEEDASKIFRSLYNYNPAAGLKFRLLFSEI